MSFLKTLNSMRCCKAFLKPAVPSPVFHLPTSLCSQQICAPRKITEFSKKTGDYTSLSAVDIQVMALTYQLEKQHVGSDHLHSEPRVARVASFSEQLPSAHPALAGFYMPPQKTNCLEFELNEAIPEERIDNVYKSSCLGEIKKGIKVMNSPLFNVLNTAPEDVEEDEKYKLIHPYNGKSQNYLNVSEDVEDDQNKSIYLKNKGDLLKCLCAPEDVEDDEKDSSIYLDHTMKLLKHSTVPEDIEEDEVHKSINFLNHHGHFLMPLYPFTQVPEDVEEDEMDSVCLKSGRENLLKSSGSAIHVPEDVEEDEVHKSIITLSGKFVKHILPVSRIAVPEDVEEDERQKTNCFVTQTFICVPEDVEEDEPKSFRCNENPLKHLYPVSKIVSKLPEDAEENEIYKSTSRKYFLLYSNVMPGKDTFIIHPYTWKM